MNDTYFTSCVYGLWALYILGILMSKENTHSWKNMKSLVHPVNMLVKQDTYDVYEACEDLLSIPIEEQ